MNIKQLAIETVEELSGIKFEEFTSTGGNGRITRKRQYVVLRRILIVFLKQDSEYSLKGIGQILNGQDHSTVIHALNEHENSMQFNKEYRMQFARYNARYLEKKMKTPPINEAISQAYINVTNTYINCAQL